MSEFKITSITNRDGSHGPQVCGIVTFTGSGLTLPSGGLSGPRGRGVIAGGYNYPSGEQSQLQLIEIATKGDATDFGDLTGLYSVGSATSNNTRGVFCGGYTAPSKHNLMEFVTIATTGNTSDFGDMLYSRRDFGVCSDSHGGLS